MARELLGDDRYPGSVIAAMLEQSLAKLHPLADLFDAHGLRGLSDEQRSWLESNATLRTLGAGEVLVREGDPSLAVFVIKRGLVEVVLETATGGARVARCCYPGWLLGESSVLGEKAARCTATLRAARETEVWVIDAGVLARVMSQNEALRMRISATKHIHRIDSFFSMHEVLGPLDVAVRDEILGCLHSIQSIEEDTVVVTAGVSPAVACLLARGERGLYGVPAPDVASPPVATVGSDRFFAVRDALHDIASPRTAVARRGATIVLFDAARLRAFAQASPAHVVAALERLD
ncbi:cyclic nucleotide-binding domain-containing protein [bacterium]|nr:MAG: cyclic nucleotide-binding domain-containing protein [bacterium]